MSNGFRQRIADFIAAQARPPEKYGHQPRLYALTLQVGEGLVYDDDVVYAAAWLHDIGVFVGHRPESLEELRRWDNTAYAVREVPAILERFGFPNDKIPAVIESIRTHQPAYEPSTIEGQILRDADILEQLGAIGILRTSCKIGRDQRFPDFTAAVSSLEHALDTLPGLLRLETSKALALPKTAVLRAFLDAVKQEAQPALY